MKLREKLPLRLQEEPLLEAIWEVRFRSSNQTIIELLSGVILQLMKGELTNTERLPAVPKELREQRKEFTYAATTRLVGERFVVSVGDRSVALSSVRPYCGWSAFKGKIEALLATLNGTNAIDFVESFSMKYIDALTEPIRIGLGATSVNVTIADRVLKGEPILVRTEFTEMGLTHIVQIGLPAQMNMPAKKETFSGILIDVDTHFNRRPDEQRHFEWIGDHLDEVHSANKRLFFSLLTDETIGLLGPVY